MEGIGKHEKKDAGCGDRQEGAVEGRPGDWGEVVTR